VLSTQGADGRCNRQVALSLPGSRKFLPAATARAPYPGSVLSALRDRNGRPNLRVKLLALVVALMLAGPLTVLVVRLVAGAVDALY
jgi:hypothetical protein